MKLRSLIRTKLHRPLVSKDHLYRQHLFDRLDRWRQRTLTIVSAPAGYGKSSLVSHWLETGDIPHAWLSLDKNDNDPHLFFYYFITAIKTLYREQCNKTLALLETPEIPPVSVLAPQLINELSRIEKNFLLVLDDYHTICEKYIHDMIAELLAYPPESMHLVVVSRRDPPFPISRLRARGQISEIRVQDLRFSVHETKVFLRNMTGIDVDRQTAAVISDKTEGWVSGLLLAVLSFNEQQGLERISEELPDNNRYIMDYMISEVLSNQPADIRNCLLFSSFPDRFCAPLCEALFLSENVAGTSLLSGETFIELIEQDNMFVIPLDGQRHWFRFHYLFRQLLHREMNQQYNPDTIRAMNILTAKWFEQNNCLDEALRHLLTAGNISAARELVTTHRNELTKCEQWQRIEWLSRAPFNIHTDLSPLYLTNQPLLKHPLTNREIEILSLLGQRLRNKEIAEKLFISPDTVKRHTINIYSKLNVHNRKDAVKMANALGMI